MLEISGFLSVYEYAHKNCIVIEGADEAGRGPLAGPVVAAAVVMKGVVEGVDDSKKLSEKKRDLLYEKILENAKTYGVGVVSEKEIDKINILNAARDAFKIAVSRLQPFPALVVNDEIKGLQLGVENLSI